MKRRLLVPGLLLLAVIVLVVRLNQVAPFVAITDNAWWDTAWQYHLR
jgi:hypothetical protein